MTAPSKPVADGHRASHARDLLHTRLVRDERTGTVLLLAALSMFAAWLTLHYGRRGLMPLDASVIWDGAWRTLDGQVPFRDYTTPDGITPIFMQALLFKVLGVSWLAYCLHAALVNAAFALVVYWLLREVELGRIPAAAYGCLSAIVLYPPVGTPLMGQHSFAFLLLALAATTAGIRSERSRRQIALLALGPPAEALALLSKHQPAGYGFVALAGLLATTPVHAVRRVLAVTAASAAATAGAILGLSLLAGVDFGLAQTYLVELPANTGRTRSSALLEAGRWFESWGLFTPRVVYVGIGALALYVLLRQPSRTSATTRALLLAALLMVITEAYVMLTFNQPADGFAFLFVALGLLHAALQSTLRPARTGAALLAAAVIAVGLADAWRVNRHVNATRAANDMVYVPPTRAEQAALPGELSFLRWDTPPLYSAAEDYALLVRFLEREPGNFLLFGDSSIVYALADRPSTSPILWLQEGLTYPGEPRGRAALERRYIDNLRRYRVRRVVFEKPWLGSTISEFRRLEAYVARRACGEQQQRIGGFTIVPLC